MVFSLQCAWESTELGSLQFSRAQNRLWFNVDFHFCLNRMDFLHESPLLWFYPGPLSQVINDLWRHKINLLPLWFTNSMNQKSLGLFSNLFPGTPIGLLVGWRQKTNGQFRGSLWNGSCESSLYSLPPHLSSQILLTDLLPPPNSCCVEGSIFSKLQPYSRCHLEQVLLNTNWGKPPFLAVFLGRMGQSEFHELLESASLTIRVLLPPLFLHKQRKSRDCFSGRCLQNRSSLFFFYPPPILQINVLFWELFLVAQGSLQRVDLLEDHASSSPQMRGAL